MISNNRRGQSRPAGLFDIEQQAEAGQVKDLTHGRIDVANNHRALAVHPLSRAEQHAESRAGDVLQLLKVKYQLLSVSATADVCFHGRLCCHCSG